MNPFSRFVPPVLPLALPFALAALLAACSDGAPAPGPPSGPDPARVEVVPGALLLLRSGESARLEARALDADGVPTEVGIAWRSLDPDEIRVDEDGLVTALVDAGAGRVVARAGGVESPPVLVTVAEPVPGAVPVADAQVLSPPTAIDEGAAYGLGWRYRVVLAEGVPLEVGAVVLGTGETPLGGRVVAIAAVPDGREATVEVIGAEEMFARLEIDETLSLAWAELEPDAALLRDFEVERGADGALTFTARPGALPSSSAVLSPQALTEFALGPFACEAEAGAAPLQLGGALSFTVDPSLDLDLAYDSRRGGLQRLALRGGVAAEMKAEPKIETSFEGKVVCKAEVAILTLPIGGPLALLFGGQVPLGAGFELGGKTTLAGVGVAIGVKADARFELGVDCRETCAMIAELDSDADGGFAPSLPDPGEQFRVELGAYGFGYAELSIGPRFLRALRFDALEVRAGLRQSLNLAPVAVQVADAGYRSGYALSLLGTAKAGSGIEAFRRMLSLGFAEVEVKTETVLDASPRGGFAIAPGSVRPGSEAGPGDPATLTVTLDDASYLGRYAVEGVEVLWRRGEGLEPAGSGCGSIPASPGQTVFRCRTDFAPEHAGPQTFHAFVRATLLDLPLPVLLEVADDGSARVTVEGGGEDPEDAGSGTWTGAYDGSFAGPLEAELRFDGERVSGTGSASGYSGTISGRLTSETTISFGLAAGYGVVIDYDGTIDPARREIRGTWAATSGPIAGATGAFEMTRR